MWRSVLISPQGIICHSFVVMKFVFESKGGHDVLLLLWLKSRGAGGISRHPVFMGNCPTFSYTS